MQQRGRKRRDRGAQFIRSNLELLGFGDRRDALVQAVKELFENAMDATQSLGSNVSWDDAPLELLRISVQLNKDTEEIDIVCADTGSGMRAHQIKLLCCNAFETTKLEMEGNGGPTSGKYGLGLKAAMLYSQLHASEACLKVATTSHSDGILYVQLCIDADSEETAVVKQVAHFVVDEEHQHFSGTEVRLSVPCPVQTVELQSAADTLAMYFQSLRYTAPPFLGVQFDFNVKDVHTSVACHHREEPIDRFAADLGATADDVLYAVDDGESVSISCVAIMLGDAHIGASESDIEVCLLRFANHAPLINGEDFFLCGITKGVCTAKLWKKFGLRCQRQTSKLVNQLVATPVRATNRRESDDVSHLNRLVLAVDVCIADDVVGEGIKYGGLKKSTVDACYADGVQTCCQRILLQLAEAGRLCSPQQRQDHDLIENLAPLIAKSLTAIVKQSLMHQPGGIASSQLESDLQGHCDEGLILQELRLAVQNR
uniref:Histidine kinase/HSP90-like ATPase domain-containing protein n=1 Tax=Peronospora matthiolae TaxID=2874970 RepID=A0AAV1U3X8_9STRA